MESVRRLLNKGIRRRMVKYFMLIILLTIGILNILMIGYIRNYYYSSTEQILENQLNTSADFYNKNFSYLSLEENIYDNIDMFWNESNVQVQIIDVNGKLLMDSLGVKEGRIIDTPDVKKALDNGYERWIGDGYNGEKVMAVSRPLMSSGKVTGVLRYITSLKDVNRSIKIIMIVFSIVSLIVLCIGLILSLVVCQGIINPIKELTTVAETMASGNLEIRSINNSPDEIGKLSSTLNYMAEELSKKEKLKNNFISSVSHELRTPLTAIKGWVITLNSDLKDEEILKVGFDIIEKETERLSNMVEELLDFSRLVSGKIDMKKELLDLKEVVDYIAIYLKPRAERENIDFQINVQEGLPKVWIDPDRMKQVFINILDNAFKFSENDGKVELNILKSKENLIKIAIKDNGCGIDEDILPRIKEKFVKGRNSKSQNGIGLSICDEIIDQHGGTLNIFSKENVGTEVVIKLPTAFRD